MAFARQIAVPTDHRRITTPAAAALVRSVALADPRAIVLAKEALTRSVALLAALAFLVTDIAVSMAAPAKAATTAALPVLELEVELDPVARRLDAAAQVASEARRSSTTFTFALHESLRVRAATLNGKPTTAIAGPQQGALRRWQIAAPSAGTLRIEYGGTLPALDRTLDHRDVLQQLPPMVGSDGSYLPGGSGWYPEPAARFAYRVALSVPADQRALVPGRLVTETLPANSNGRYRARFEFPSGTDGIELMAGPWVVRERMLARTGDTPIRLRTYFPAALDATPGLPDSYLDDTRRYLERYSAEIGSYPFTEFSVVAGPLPTGFGMPTLTYIGADVLRLPFIRATSLGHEVLHNWWGNGVEVDYAHGNWCEGLTTFMADYAYQEETSLDAAREMRLRWLRDFAAVPAGSDQSLASFRSRAHGAAAAVGYGKSAMVFVMLKDEIGTDAFRRGIRDFWAAQRFRVAGWSDLQRTFEQASGRSLETFFAQWVQRPGAPSLRLAMARAQGGAGRPQVALAIEQTSPPYALRVPIELVRGPRSEARRVGIAVEREVVAVEASEPPDGVRLDPDLRIWRRLDRDQLPPILRQWIIARAPTLVQASSAADVRAAAEALGKRLFEQPAQTLGLEVLGKKGPGEPVLLVGLHADVDATLARSGLPARPSQLAGRGSAQVWTIARADGAPIAVVSAADAEAIAALQRPLPHYGSQSWLVFDGAKMLERGVWPAAEPLIPVTASGVRR